MGELSRPRLLVVGTKDPYAARAMHTPWTNASARVWWSVNLPSWPPTSKGKDKKFSCQSLASVYPWSLLGMKCLRRTHIAKDV